LPAELGNLPCVRHGSKSPMWRTHGAAFLARYGYTLSGEQHRALRVIAVCRTAALGGHITQCDQCGHEVPRRITRDGTAAAPHAMAQRKPRGSPPENARCSRHPRRMSSLSPSWCHRAPAPAPLVPGRRRAQWWAACPFLSTWLPHLTHPATAPAPLVSGRSRGVPLPPAPGVRRAALTGQVSPMLTGCSRESPCVPVHGRSPDSTPWATTAAGCLDSGASPGLRAMAPIMQRVTTARAPGIAVSSLGCCSGARLTGQRGCKKRQMLPARSRCPQPERKPRHGTAPDRRGSCKQSRKRSGPQTMCLSSTVSSHRSLQKCSRSAFAASKPDCRAWPTCSLTRSPNGQPIDR
jgi:hypothetical protein